MDLIDRQAAIEVARKAIWNYHGELFQEINSREDRYNVIWKIINPAIPSVIVRCVDAIKALPSAQPEIIRCKDCIKHIDNRCVVANHHTSDKEDCMSVFGAERREHETD